MTEEEIRAELDRLCEAVGSKGYTNRCASVRIANDGRATVYFHHNGTATPAYAATVGEAISLAFSMAAEMPSEQERNTRAAVEALEAARLACEKIDADDVAASLAALVTRLSEDLIEHKEGAA